MHDINLLRPLIEQQQTVSKTRGRYSFYITFTIILLLIITAIVFGLRLYLAQQSKSLDSKIKSLEQEVSQVKTIEDNINNFNNTITQLKSVDKNKLAWSTIYDNIAKSTPADVKLNQVVLISSASATISATTTTPSTTKTTSTTTSTPSKLKITGETKSRRSIALFAYKLQKVGGNFVSVDLISSKKTEAETAQSQSTPEQIAAGKGTTGTITIGEEKIDFEINITLKSS